MALCRKARSVRACSAADGPLRIAISAATTAWPVASTRPSRWWLTTCWAARTTGTVADVRLSGNVTVQGNAFNAASQLVKLDGSTKLPAVEEIQTDDGQLRCRWKASQEELPDLHKRIVERGVELMSFSLRTDNLEDIYMKVSGHRTS